MTGPQQPYGYGPPPGYSPPRPPRRGLPAWAVALLAVGGVAAVLLVLATCAALVASTDSRTATATSPSASPAGSLAPAPAEQPPPATGPTGLFQHPEDVALETCGAGGSLGWGEATVRVTNTSSEASTYSVEIAFESPSGETLHGSGYAFVPRLEPGQTTVEDVLSASEVPPDVVCRVTQASRYRD